MPASELRRELLVVDRPEEARAGRALGVEASPDLSAVDDRPDPRELREQLVDVGRRDLGNGRHLAAGARAVEQSQDPAESVGVPADAHLGFGEEEQGRARLGHRARHEEGAIFSTADIDAHRGKATSRDTSRVRLLLAYRTLDAPAGSESYLVLMAEQLLRLGHEPRIWSPAPGRMAEVARTRGIPVDASLDDVPGDLDGLIAQDTETAYALRVHRPDPPLLFVAHSAINVAQDPPRLEGVADRIVVMNERMRARIEAGPVPCPIVRLRQPIDRERFRWGAPLTRLRRVLLFGHHLSPERWATSGQPARRSTSSSTSPAAPRPRLSRSTRWARPTP